MGKQTKFYIVAASALPDIFIKVARHGGTPCPEAPPGDEGSPELCRRVSDNAAAGKQWAASRHFACHGAGSCRFKKARMEG